MSFKTPKRRKTSRLATSKKVLELWRNAEEIFIKSPDLVKKEIRKYVNVILVKTEIEENGTLPTIGNKVLRFAKNGQLEPLKKLLKANNFLPEIINHSNQWKAVEERCLRTVDTKKSCTWKWIGDTPLLEAIWAGHHDIVKFLLRSGADPTIGSYIKGLYGEYDEDASELAQRLGDPQMISLVGLAIPFWEEVINYSYPGCTRDFSTPNRPKSFLKLRKALENC